MTPIFFTVLMIAIAMAVTTIAILRHNLRREKRAERLSTSFDRLATGFKLSIAERQKLGNRMIGHDRLNKKLLFLTLTGYKQQDSYFVDLKEVRSVTVHKVYGPVRKNRAGLNIYIEMLILQVNYKNGDKGLVLPFYDMSLDMESELKEREKHAKNWQRILTAGLAKETIGLEGQGDSTGDAHVKIVKRRVPLYNA